MGIDLNSAQLLIKTHKDGVLFGRLATLGRQRLLGSRLELVSILRKSGYILPDALAQRLLDPRTEYSEEFFKLLGAQEIVALDVSDFEGAQVLHDMNHPIPDGLISTFDVVLDGGTLEHIFNTSIALRNVAQMLRPNGRFISLTMANNFCGHGFYQFSPELFYRFFSPENGFIMEYCVVWEDVPRSSFYYVPDPDSVRSRINLTSEVGTYMIVQAKRIGEVSLRFVPQQSDYMRQWEAGKPAEFPKHFLLWPKLRSFLKRIPKVQATVVSARKLLRMPTLHSLAEYRRLRIARNSNGFLEPVKDLRVIR
jgi:SAM-dependent methyltransferase